MERRSGLQAELLSSLALVMALGMSLLAAVLLLHGEARLRDLLGRALLAEARSPTPVLDPLVPGTRWWRVDASGASRPLDGAGEAIDAESARLAAEAEQRGAALLGLGAPWQSVRFAAPRTHGEVLVARLPREASLRLRAAPWVVAFGVLVADALIFSAFGARLLRGRVVLPLARLAAAARAIADGAFDARAPVEGTRETATVARAFNEMTDALARRGEALEKAVRELREANQSLRTAEAGLARAERLAAVGRLAAGVAHEVGNPLGAMLAFLDLARREAALSEEGRAHLEKAGREGERVRRILRQLLDFSRPPALVPGPLDLARVAAETASLVSAQRRYAAVSIRVECQGAVPQADADAGAVAQILLNLLLNAADATLSAPTPWVRVMLRPAPLRLRAGEAPEAADGRRRPDGVACEVSDGGPGVAEEDRERIFDPFFTTKPPGEGTGLGLANALRLAEELGGSLELAPAAPGEGACFVLRLPAVGGPASDCGVRSELRSERAPAGSGPAAGSSSIPGS